MAFSDFSKHVLNLLEPAAKAAAAADSFSINLIDWTKPEHW